MLAPLRGVLARLFTPTARLLMRWNVSPDVVTWFGTVGVIVTSVLLLSQGHLAAGGIIVGIFALLDSLDGVLARAMGRVSKWGAFLDSSLDRIADAAVFCSLAWWYLTGGDHQLIAFLALLCLSLGALVSYTKARAESLGGSANVGVFERADRLVVALVAAGVTDLGVGMWAPITGLGIVAAGSLYTATQRMRAAARNLS